MFVYILFQQQPVMLADSSIIHTQFHQPHVLVPANPYLHEGKEKKIIELKKIVKIMLY